MHLGSSTFEIHNLVGSEYILDFQGSQQILKLNSAVPNGFIRCFVSSKFIETNVRLILSPEFLNLGDLYNYLFYFVVVKGYETRNRIYLL